MNAKTNDNIKRVETISQLHRELGIDGPKHPLVSVLPITNQLTMHNFEDITFTFDFYQVAMKSGVDGQFIYGRNKYDFHDGAMVFTQPGQAQQFERNQATENGSGWVLFFHPDLIRRSNLGQAIHSYSFFNYDVNEALHLSERERQILSDLVHTVDYECDQNMDQHTQTLIINNIELILNYCVRFYDRQFYVRSNLNQDTIGKFEAILREYFATSEQLESGLPTVQWCANALNMSAGYLSDMLKKETGMTTQQHIQHFVIDEAKNRLLGSKSQVSQIAYDLGFDYPQHFSKLFKAKTGMTPAEFRKGN